MTMQYLHETVLKCRCPGEFKCLLAALLIWYVQMPKAALLPVCLPKQAWLCCTCMETMVWSMKLRK